MLWVISIVATLVEPPLPAWYVHAAIVPATTLQTLDPGTVVVDSLTTNDGVMINSGKAQNLSLYKIIHLTCAAKCRSTF